MYNTLAQAVLVPVAAATSQARGEEKTPVARTPKQRVQVDQILEVIPVPPAIPDQPEDRATASKDEQRRFERFKNISLLHSVLRGVAYQWWRTFEFNSPAKATSLTWTQFSDMFLREFVPQSLRDAWGTEFEHLRQGTMTILEYAVRFTDLARHEPALVATVRDRIRQFIEGFIPSIKSIMAHEFEMDISYQQVVSIAGRVEAIPPASGIPARPRPQDPSYAPRVSSAPPARGAFSGQTSRPRPS
ncbi:uncharacterized protein [Nicotiana sylvestris]|uniref:uncharacterized protein n=1 Tax=Nicotiana sylvestris TaxID=4096 RepID=UPI00388C4D2A